MENEKYQHSFLLHDGVERIVKTEIGDFTFLNKDGLLNFKKPLLGIMDYNRFSSDGDQVISYKHYLNGEEWEVSINIPEGGKVSLGYIILQCMGDVEEISEEEQYEFKDLFTFGDITDVVTDYYP